MKRSPRTVLKTPNLNRRPRKSIDTIPALPHEVDEPVLLGVRVCLYVQSTARVCVCHSLLFVLGLRARRRVGAAHVQAGVQLALVGGLQDLEGAHQCLVH